MIEVAEIQPVRLHERSVLPDACPHCKANLTPAWSLRVRRLIDTLSGGCVRGGEIQVGGLDHDYQGEEPLFLEAICNACGHSVVDGFDLRFIVDPKCSKCGVHLSSTPYRRSGMEYCEACVDEVDKGLCR